MGMHALKLAALATASAAALCAGSAFAQSAAAAAGDGGEIVVTAQKRQERLQDVPLSVTAVSGEAMARQRIVHADDLVAVVPNLQRSSTNGESVPIFALRGVKMSDYSLNQSSPVATYYDEVYKGNFAFLGVAMFDLERVEVLRGPQGTLYGKNTTGGAINLVARKPVLGELSGNLDAGYGNYNRVDSNGAISVPLGDKAALRVCDGDRLEIGGKGWSVIAGGGHSPEHACLHCPELGLFISGDKVLPTISSNISVEPAEPASDPLAEWFQTLATIRDKVPDDVMVLPSHGRCFFGLHDRIDRLLAEQRDALGRLAQALGQPRRVDELFGILFSRPIARGDAPLMGLATGETLALLNHLIATGIVRCAPDDRGVALYQRAGQTAA